MKRERESSNIASGWHYEFTMKIFGQREKAGDNPIKKQFRLKKTNIMESQNISLFETKFILYDCLMNFTIK